MLYALITVSAVLLDIVTKYLVVRLLVPLKNSVTVIPHVLSFTYVENRGAAWGMFADSRWIFMLLSAFLIVFLICFIKFSKIRHPLFTVAASLVLGGGIGNMIDRVFIGSVVDFIKADFVDFPVFNIADSCVVVGVVLMAVYIIFFDKRNSTDRRCEVE